MTDLGGRRSDLWPLVVMDRLAELWADQTQTARGIAAILCAEFYPGYTKGAVIGKVHRTRDIRMLRPYMWRGPYKPRAKLGEDPMVNVEWPQDQFDRVASLLRAGKTPGQITGIISGLSRNAICGKIDRSPELKAARDEGKMPANDKRRLSGAARRARPAEPKAEAVGDVDEVAQPIVAVAEIAAPGLPEAVPAPVPEVDKSEPPPPKIAVHAAEIKPERPRPVRPEDFIATAPPTVRDYDEPRTDGLISIWQLTESSCHWPVGDPLTPSFGYCGKQKPFGPKQPYCADHQWRSETPRATWLRRNAA